MHDESEIIDGLMQDAEAALARGVLNKASALYQGILSLNPDHVAALRQLGAIAVNNGEPEKALELFQRASSLDPADPDLYHGVGTALRLMGQGDEALFAFEAALRVNKTHEPALYDKALMLQQRGKLKLATKLYQRIVHGDAGHFEAAFNHGVALFRADLLLEAERWFHRAALVEPHDPRPFINLAMIYRVWGYVPEAIACLERALKEDPGNIEGHWNLANALLVNGDLARGFTEYEWRFRRAGRGERQMTLPRWAGEPLAGRTLLITAEQGMGDIIHFVRFAKEAAARGGPVVVECHPGLEKLVATAPGVSRAVPLGAAVTDASCYAPLMSLPHILGTTLDTIPASAPYLSVPPGTPAATLGGQGLRVGLVWRGNPMHENDRWRSVPLQLLESLLAVSGVSFHSLQLGEGAAELAASPWAGQIIDLAPQLSDFARTAAAVAALDLIITVDTAVAHLAGALAKPAWLLVQNGNDWRWFNKRTDSPWYPTLRLFRQGWKRNWAPALKDMTAQLTALAEQH